MGSWKINEFARMGDALAAEPGKLKKRTAMAEALRAAGDDAGRLALYIAGQPFAEADPRKLNTGAALLSRAVKGVCGASDAALTAAYRRYGDLGAAAQAVWGDSRPGGTVTLAEVETSFDALARARTTAAREAIVQGLLARTAGVEAKYLLKLMLGDLRIGVKQSLVEEAIAEAAGAEVAAVRHAVTLEADLARVTAMAFAGTLAEARMRLFHPLGFMLASPVETAEEAVKRFAGEDADSAVQIAAFLEDKFDGMRAQVHSGDPEQPGRVAIYSRNREDITESYPELVEAFAGVREPLILDGEVLGWDVREERALPFSILGNRIGRKRVDDALRRAIPVIFMAFDVLYAPPEPALAAPELLLALPLSRRRAILEKLAARSAGVTRSPVEPVKAQGGLFAQPEAEELVARLRVSPARRVSAAEEIDREYGEARLRGNEGVMLKAAESVYQPGRRGMAWVKLKRELATLDVVITGAEFGHGRRAGLLSDYTFAVRGADGTLLNVGKAYSGMTDVEIAAMTAWLKEHTLEDHGHFRTVEPLRVLEVAFNNVMRSDRHASGFALRFPRILRIRDDKPVEEIDTLERVEEVWASQPDKGRE